MFSSSFRSPTSSSPTTSLRWTLLCLFVAAVAWPQLCFSQETTTPGTAQQAGNGALNSVGEKVAGNLLKEMTRMIPGDVEPGSKLETSLKEVAELFAKRQLNDAKSALWKIKANESRVPPIELLFASMAYAVGDGNSGRRLLESAAISHGDYPDIYFSFARLALGQNRITDADALADKALLTIQSSNGAFDEDQLSHFKRRYYDTKYQVAKSRGKKDEARAAVAELEKVSPGSVPTLLARAEVAFEFDEVDKSLEILRQLEKLKSGDNIPPAEVTVASWLQRKGKPEDAGLLLKQAASERRSNEKVQLAFAQWLISREDFPGTLSAIKRIEEINGDSSASRELRGKVAFAQGAYAMAEGQFKRLTTDNPTNFDYANLYALSLAHSPKKEKQDLAVNLARQVAQAKTNNVVAVSSLAYVLMKSGQIDAAKAILAKVIKQRNLNPEVTFIVCYMLSETGQKDQSQAVLRKVLNSKGLFLFRTEAKKLLKMNSQSTGGLPAPGQ